MVKNHAIPIPRDEAACASSYVRNDNSMYHFQLEFRGVSIRSSQEGLLTTNLRGNLNQTWTSSREVTSPYLHTTGLGTRRNWERSVRWRCLGMEEVVAR